MIYGLIWSGFVDFLKIVSIEISEIAFKDKDFFFPLDPCTFGANRGSVNEHILILVEPKRATIVIY